MKVLLVADLVVLLGLVAAWTWWSRDDSQASVGHGGLHGSVPPRGQYMPNLASIDGMSPRVPSARALRGHRVLLVGTCFECRSGDVIGGALRRLAASKLPDDVRIVAVGWNGSAANWRSKWSLPARIDIHGAAAGTPAMELATTLRLEPTADDSTGFGYLYDASGRWRSTFPAQLMLPDDVIHDVRAIG